MQERIKLANRRARKRAGGVLTRKDWLGLVAFYNFQCLACGLPGDAVSLTADHIIPLAHGGANTSGNIQPLCRGCNNRKHLAHTDYRLTLVGLS